MGASATVEELTDDPHPLLARLRESEPVSFLPALGAWLVSRRDLALAVMRDPWSFTVDDPRFSTAQVVGPSMLSLDGVEHGRNREPFARPFRLDAIRERFTGLVEAEVERLLGAIEPAGEAELRRALAGPLSVAMMVAALGLEEIPAETALNWYDAIVRSVTAITAGGPATAEGEAAFAALGENVGVALRVGARSSLVAAAAGDAGGLDAAQVASNAAVLLFGGIETTEGMIANAIFHLLGDREQAGRAARDPALLANAIEESLRLEPAAAIVDRYATRTIQLGQATIGRGDLVTVSIAGANRDPSVFLDPDRFDASRPNTRLHLAFAQGPHVCLGMHLARLETQVALGRLLERFPRIELDRDRTSRPAGLVFRKPDRVWAVWDREGGTVHA